MKVKGKLVTHVLKLVKSMHPVYYNEWMKSLPVSSKEIYSTEIISGAWYPAYDSFIVPIRIMSYILFKDEQTGAWQCGRYSAKMEYSAIHRIFSKLASPDSVIKKGMYIFNKSFENSEIIIAENDKNNVTFKIVKLSEPDSVFENWIAGWIEEGLEISGCTDISVTIPQRLTNGVGGPTNILISWK